MDLSSRCWTLAGLLRRAVGRVDSRSRSATLQLRRQILQLTTLIVLAAAAFGVARAVAVVSTVVGSSLSARLYRETAPLTVLAATGMFLLSLSRRPS